MVCQAEMEEMDPEIQITGLASNGGVCSGLEESKPMKRKQRHFSETFKAKVALEPFD